MPAVEFVQEMRDKQVVHVGFGGHMNELRGKCRHRIDLGRDRLFRRVQRPRSSAEPVRESPRPQPRGGGSSQAGSKPPTASGGQA